MHEEPGFIDSIRLSGPAVLFQSAGSEKWVASHRLKIQNGDECEPLNHDTAPILMFEKFIEEKKYLFTKYW